MVVEAVAAIALGDIEGRFESTCYRKSDPRAPGLVVERAKGVEAGGHGRQTRPARVELLALVVDRLRRHRSLVAEPEDRKARGARLQGRVVGDVRLLEHHVLRHQEDGQVESESRVAGDVGAEDLAALRRQFIDQRGAELRTLLGVAGIAVPGCAA